MKHIVMALLALILFVGCSASTAESQSNAISVKEIIPESQSESLESSANIAQSEISSEPAEIPEWKSVYLPLVMDAIIGTRNLPGIAVNYGIELYDAEQDGVPELQECVTAHNNDYSMWFIEDGQARQITGKIPFEPGRQDMTAFVNLLRHNETGDIVAIHLAGSAFFTDEYCFVPVGDNEVWALDVIWGTSSASVKAPQKQYTCTNSDGTEYVISEEEYKAWADSILNEHTRLMGEFLPLSNYFRIRENTTETFSAKLEKASKAVSDYFDSYDGVDSMAYKEYNSPTVIE